MKPIGKIGARTWRCSIHSVDREFEIDRDATELCGYPRPIDSVELR